MLQASLRHRVALIDKENAIGRMAARHWMKIAGAAERAVREFWPSTDVLYPPDRHRLTSQITQAVLLGAVNTAEALKPQLFALVDREHAWAVSMLKTHIPDTVWAFVGGPAPAKTVTEKIAVDLVRPIDAAVAQRLLAEPLAGMTWEERFAMLADEQRIRLNRTIATSMGEAEGIPGTVRRVRQSMEWGAVRAALVARTEVHHVSSRAQEEVYNANQDVLNGIEYTATLDERCCMECGGYDGQVYYYNPTGGEQSVDSAPSLPIHARCRCCYTPITKWAETIGLRHPTPGMRSAMDGPVPETQTFKTWLRQQNAATQDKVMGKARGLAWRESGMKGLPKK